MEFLENTLGLSDGEKMLDTGRITGEYSMEIMS